MGGRRWIKLPGGIHFQPSEWVKLVLIVAVARYFWSLSGKELTWKEIAKAFLLVCVPMLLVLKQPDLGTALTYLPILVCGLLLGGLRLKQAAILMLGFALLAGGVWKTGKLLKPYQKARLTSFLDPDSDPRGSGYQIRQSLIAVGSGGIWGKGANRGTQTQGDFLPIPYTDFIFAAFCEEHGFLGAIGVLLLYFFILMRLIQNAQTAADLFRQLPRHGRRRRHRLPDRRQHRHGRRPHARHRHPSPPHELRRLLHPVHLSRARHRDERAHAPLRKLGRAQSPLRKERKPGQPVIPSSSAGGSGMGLITVPAGEELTYATE